jgi:amphiphysin
MFDMLNDQLIAEIPQLLNLRVPYFDPSFEAMIRMQAKFAEEGYEKLSGVQRSVIFQRNVFPAFTFFFF